MQTRRNGHLGLGNGRERLTLIIFALIALVVFTTEAAPINDNFINRIHLSGVGVLTNGNNVGATREAGDPTVVGGGVCNATVWWSWTAPSNGHYAAVVIMAAPAYPLVDVFTGSTATGLTQVAYWDGRTPYSVLRRGTNCQATQVTFDAIAGTEYEVIVGAEYPSEVPFELAITVPPRISSFTPTNGTDFPVGSNVLLDTVAGDSDGSVQSVRYAMMFGSKIAEATNAPWTGTWSGPAVGRYMLEARAIDDCAAYTTAYSEVTVGRPPNDAFANRIMLQGSPVFTQGPIYAAGKEPGEPSAIGSFTSFRTIWWSWVAPSDGRYAVIASATNLVTVGVYTGNDINALFLNAFSQSSHNALINGQSRLCRQAEWEATAGTTYHICVDGGSASPFEVGLAITRPPQLTVVSPADGSVFSSPAGIQVSALPFDSDGSIQRLDFFEVHTAPGSGWSVPVGTLTTGPWNLVWNTASTGNYPLAARVVDNLGAATISSNRIWVGVTRPPNDDFAQSIVISNLRTNLTVTGSNNWATGETGEPYGRSSVWWSWTAPATGPTVIDTCGSFYNAYLKVFTGSSITNLFYFGAAAGSPCASLPFTAEAGTTYHIAVEGDWGQGQIQLNLQTPPSPPVWLSNPQVQPDRSLTLNAFGVPGQKSVLEASTDLNQWFAIATNDFTGNPLLFRDPALTQFSRRFYRIRQR